MAQTPEQKAREEKLLKILLGVAAVLALVVALALINTHTDVFKTVAKALKSEPQRKKSKPAKPSNANKKVGKGSNSSAAGENGEDGEPGDEDSKEGEQSPGNKFRDEVMHGGYGVLLVRAQFDVGKSCKSQLELTTDAYKRWKGSEQIRKSDLHAIRAKATKHSKVKDCVVSVYYSRNKVMEAVAGGGGRTKVKMLE